MLASSAYSRRKMQAVPNIDQDKGLWLKDFGSVGSSVRVRGILV